MLLFELRYEVMLFRGFPLILVALWNLVTWPICRIPSCKLNPKYFNNDNKIMNFNIIAKLQAAQSEQEKWVYKASSQYINLYLEHNDMWHYISLNHYCKKVVPSSHLSLPPSKKIATNCLNIPISTNFCRKVQPHQSCPQKFSIKMQLWDIC